MNQKDALDSMRQRVYAGYRRSTARQTMSPAIFGYALGTKNPPPTLLILGLAHRSRQRVQASLQNVRIINLGFCAGCVPCMRRIYVSASALARLACKGVLFALGVLPLAFLFGDFL